MSPLTGQWADALLEAEQLHLVKLLVWATLSVIVGTGILALARARRVDSPFLSQFAIQAVAWGVVDAVMVFWARQGLHLRDLAGAVALDRFVWLSIGLEAGCAAIGVTLALVGWRLGVRLGLIGAGLGVLVQGLALAVLDLQLASAVVR